ncbi:MAG: phage tail tape measure protein, partial [Desulfatirhabdiaceae bacterium]
SGVDKFTPTVNAVENSLSSLNSNVEDLTQPLASFATAVEGAGLALTAIAAGSMAAAVTAAGSFGDQVKEIHTLFEESTATYDQYDAAILDYATTSTQSMSDINKALYESISAGVKYEDSIAFLTDAEKLAVAGKAELADSVKILTGTMNAYGAEASLAGEYSDILFTAVKLGTTTVPELGQSLGQVTGIAASANVPFSDLSAAIAALTASGLPTSQAITGIKSAIENIIKPTEGAQKAADALGIQFDAEALKSRGLEGVLKDVITATGGNVAEVGKLFTTVDSLNASLTLGTDKSGLFKSALQGMEDSAGATQKAYDEMVTGFENTNTRLTNTITAALVTSGKPLLDDWADIATGLGEVFKGLKVGMDAGAFDDIYNAIDDFASNLSADLKTIGANLPAALETLDFSGMLKAFDDLGISIKDVFSALFGDIDLTTPEGLSKALQTMVNAFESFIKISDGIITSFKPIAGYLGELASGAIGAEGETKKLLGTISGFGQQLNIVTGLLPTFGTALSVLAGASMLQSITNVGILATNLTMLAGPIGVVAGAAAILGTAIGGLSGPIDVLNEGMSGFEDEIGRVDNKMDGATNTMKLAAAASGIFGSALNEIVGPIDVLNEGMSGFEDEIGPVETGMEKAAEAAEVLRFKIGETGEAIEQFPSVFELEMNASESDAFKDAKEYLFDTNPISRAINYDLLADDESVTEAIQRIKDFEKDMAGGVETKFMPVIDEELAKTAQGTLREIIGYDDESGKPIYLFTELNRKAAEDASKELDKALPKQKEIEIALKGEIDTEIARINAAADTVQKSMEWSAKVNIAQAEADAKRLEAAFANVGSVVTGSGDVISSLFANMPDSNDPAWVAWKSALDQTQDIQREGWELDKVLLEEEIKYRKMRNAKLEAGEPLITIETNGLEPELEMVMWKIIEKVQIRASEESSNFLLGV